MMKDMIRTQLFHERVNEGTWMSEDGLKLDDEFHAIWGELKDAVPAELDEKFRRLNDCHSDAVRMQCEDYYKAGFDDALSARDVFLPSEEVPEPKTERIEEYLIESMTFAGIYHDLLGVILDLEQGEPKAIKTIFKRLCTIASRVQDEIGEQQYLVKAAGGEVE